MLREGLCASAQLRTRSILATLAILLEYLNVLIDEARLFNVILVLEHLPVVADLNGQLTIFERLLHSFAGASARSALVALVTASDPCGRLGRVCERSTREVVHLGRLHGETLNLRALMSCSPSR